MFTQVNSLVLYYYCIFWAVSVYFFWDYICILLCTFFHSNQNLCAVQTRFSFLQLAAVYKMWSALFVDFMYRLLTVLYLKVLYLFLILWWFYYSELVFCLPRQIYLLNWRIFFLQGLLDIDAVEAGHIVQRHFTQLIPDIVPHLSSRQLYLFLKGIL